MKIINIIRGGIGNQLFQWAITKTMEIKFGAEVYLDISPLYLNTGVTPRTFDLPQFPNIKYKILSNGGNEDFYSNPIIEYNEGNFNIDSTVLNEHNNYKFLDYWQSYNYFEKYKNEIKSDLSFSDGFKNEILSKYPEINTNSVSLHIRRTDYVSSNGYHPVQPISYYERALKIIGDYDNVLVFSDDIEWCKKNLNFKNQVFVENNSVSFDIWSMSLCKHNIIANSSFSWWGAWLNENENKIVVTPGNWFGWGGVPYMHPKNWLVI